MKLFPDHSLLVEEFERIKQMTADYCAGSLGRKLVVEITPSDDFTEVVTRLEQTEEFRKIISNSEPFPFEVYPDISSELKLLGIRNSVLTLSQLVMVYKVMNHARAVYDFFKERTLRFPLLFAVLNDIPFEKSIITSIEEVIDDTGSIRSSASPDLARIRKQLGRKRIEANQIYMSVIAKYRKSGWLTSEAEESWRNGRRVVAIVAEQKRTAKGIVHDISATGKTCFIEPEETLGINAMLIQLEQEEQEEIRKILKELTEHLRKYHTVMKHYLNCIVRFDMIAAKAKLAIHLDAHLPYIENKPAVDLKDAYHPLLYAMNKTNKKQTIPFSLKLNQEQRILVISGPNAGGKTVCMKTVGLLQLLLQAGFLTTCDGNSRFGFFRKILVDIGDSQSLEFELSTYSSRLQHMKVFLQQSNPDTLFLIDEFGTGTDPSLGGALAESILEEMNFRKAFGIITTHYMNLKVLADKTPGIINGSMAFDAQRLLPRFYLEVGKPGSSYTFVVAERSGLPPGVINRARKKVKKSSLVLEELLNKMEHEKGEVARLLDINKKQERKLEELINKYEKNVASQEKRSEMDDERIRQRELRLANQLEEKFKRFVKDWKESKNKKAVLDRYNAGLSNRKSKLSEKEVLIIEEQIKYTQQHIQKGKKVFLRDGKVEGVVESVDGNKVNLVFGNIKTTADISRVLLADMPKDTGIVTAKIAIDKKKENHPKKQNKHDKRLNKNPINELSKQSPAEEKKSKFLPRKKVDN